MLLHTGTPTVQLKLSTVKVARGRPYRLDWIVDLLPADLAQGLVITDAFLRIAPAFGLAPLITKLVTTAADAGGQITDDCGDDGRGALFIVLTEADTTLLAQKCAYELTGIDSLGREAVIDRGAMFADPYSIPGTSAVPHLALVTPPSSTATSGAPLTQQPTVQLLDATGAPLARAGVVVTASIASGGGGVTGATAITDANGVATFTNLAILVAAAASKLALTTQPSSVAVSGQALAQQPVVQLQDTAGLAAAQAGVVVTASVASGSATLGGTATAVTDANGQATFTNLALT